MKGQVSITSKEYTHDQIVNGANIDVSKFEIKANVPLRGSMVLTDIKFATDPNKGYFSKLPSLKTKSRSYRLKLKKKLKVNNQVIACVYSLIYKNLGETSTPQISFIYKTKNWVKGQKHRIKNVKVDKHTIGQSGGNVRVTISGNPGSKFCLVANESFYNTDGFIEHSEDVSILNDNNVAYSKIAYNNKSNFKAIQGVLDKTGKYRTTIKIPSSKSNIATVIGNIGGGRASIPLSTVKNMKEGDYFVYGAKNESLKIQPTNYVTAIDKAAKTVDLRENVTISNGTNCHSKRNKVYTIKIVEELSDINKDLNTGFLTRKVTQNITPFLGIEIQTGNPATTDIDITKVDGVAVTLSPGQSYNDFISPEDSVLFRTKKKFTKSYNIECTLTHASSSRWKTFVDPTYSVEEELEFLDDTDLNKQLIFYTRELSSNDWQQNMVKDKAPSLKPVITVSKISSSALDNGTNVVNFLFTVTVYSFGSRPSYLFVPINEFFTYQN